MTNTLVNDKHAIFYGAGEWIKRNYAPIIRLGYAPICFVDDDPAKQGTIISFGRRHIQSYEIISLENALSRFPNSNFLITVHPNSWEILKRRILENKCIKEEQILSYPDDLKLCRGCYDMQRRIEVRPTLAYCAMAMVSDVDTVPLDLSNYEKTIADFYTIRNRNIDNMKAGIIPDRCKHCKNNVEDIWFDRPAAEDVAVSLAGLCQLNCLYCDGTDRTEYSQNELTKKFDLNTFMSVLEEKELIADDAYVCIACGEPALHPNLTKMLDAAEPYYCEVLTNAAQFSEPIMNTLKNGHSDILVSVDAGTRETFKKVKRADKWDSVCENLIRYNQSGGKVFLKYIILPGVNDTMADADGFIALAQKIHAEGIMLSSNLYELKEDTRLPDQTICVLRHFLKSFRNIGINANLVSIFFTPADYERIMACL